MWRRHSPTRERRRESRKPVNWTGRCWAGADGQGDPSPCTVIDVSPSGAAIELLSGHVAARGDTLVLEVERVGTTPVMFRLHGVVRDVTAPSQDDARRVGLSLTIANRSEQRIVRAMTVP